MTEKELKEFDRLHIVWSKAWEDKEKFEGTLIAKTPTWVAMREYTAYACLHIKGSVFSTVNGYKAGEDG